MNLYEFHQQLRKLHEGETFDMNLFDKLACEWTSFKDDEIRQLKNELHQVRQAYRTLLENSESKDDPVYPNDEKFPEQRDSSD